MPLQKEANFFFAIKKMTSFLQAPSEIFKVQGVPYGLTYGLTYGLLVVRFLKTETWLW